MARAQEKHSLRAMRLRRVRNVWNCINLRVGLV